MPAAFRRIGFPTDGVDNDNDDDDDDDDDDDGDDDDDDDRDDDGCRLRNLHLPLISFVWLHLPEKMMK